MTPTEDTPTTCPTCPTGFHSTNCPYKKQDDTQLAIKRHVKFISGLSPHNLHRGEEALAELIQEAQLQLVTELTKTARHYTADGLVADALDPWAVPVKELEYKKQELEGGV